MLAKLCIVIVAVTLTAASMLTVRQQRLDAVYDMRRSIEAAAALDRQLQEVRIDVARRVTPGSVTQLAHAFGPMQSIPAEWSDPLLTVLTASNERPVEEAMDAEARVVAGEETEQVKQTDGANLGPAFAPAEYAR